MKKKLRLWFLLSFCCCLSWPLSAQDFGGTWNGWLTFSGRGVVACKMKLTDTSSMPNLKGVLMLYCGNDTITTHFTGLLTAVQTDTITHFYLKATFSGCNDTSNVTSTLARNDYMPYIKGPFNGTFSRATGSCRFSGILGRDTLTLSRAETIQELLAGYLSEQTAAYLQIGEYESQAHYDKRTTPAAIQQQQSAFVKAYFNNLLSVQKPVLHYDRSTAQFEIDPLVAPVFHVPVAIEDGQCFENGFLVWAQQNLSFSWNPGTNKAAVILFNDRMRCGRHHFAIISQP